MISPFIQYRLLHGFEDSSITPDVWNRLLHRGTSDVIFMTWHWQKVWWEVFGRGKLLLIMAEQDGKPKAIAPLFADQGMIFFVGSGGSDYLDFIGDVRDPDVLEGMLVLAIEQVPDFLGFRFYHMLESSRVPETLAEVAKRQRWHCYDEGKLASPMLALKDCSEQAYQSTRKKSLLRHETWFQRNGGLKIEHLHNSRDILLHLPAFFEQHKSRWEQTPFPSLFYDPDQRLFYQRLCEVLSETAWLRFTRVIWRGRSVSSHLGFHYEGNFLWYKPTFDIALSKHSPGEVLLRQLLLKAIEEEAHTFDFGLGDEAFKKRFATHIRLVHTWGLYPSWANKEIEYEQCISDQPSSR